jgi:hypothetical protein
MTTVRFTSFVSARALPRASRVAGNRRLLPGPGACSDGRSPFRLLTVEIIRSPKFLGGSLCRHALLYDPALVSTRSAFHRASFLPSARTHGVGFLSTCRISGFHHTAYLLAVYASPRRSPSAMQHSLSAGGHLCRAGFGPARSSSKGFRFEPTSSSASPFPWLTLAHASSPAGPAASRRRVHAVGHTRKQP